MSDIRCDVVVVQIVATEYDEQGRQINEFLLPAQKVFRARTEDFWGYVEAAMEAAKAAAKK